MTCLRMRSILGALLPLWAWVGLALLGMRADRVLVTSALAQSGAGATSPAGPDSGTIAVDGREFSPYGRTNKHYDNNPGVLKYGGYCSLGAQLEKRSYRDTSDPAGKAEITVEIAIHAQGNAYVVHDFFGTFWVIQNDKQVRTGSRHTQASSGVFTFRDIAPTGSGRPQFACITIFPKQDRKGSTAYEGIVGWYGISGKATTTVMIRFEGLEGIPMTLIEGLLAEHPSDVQDNDSRYANWVTHDVEKWTNLLQDRADEDRILQAASIHLRRYDRGSFGLSQVWARRKDADALSTGVGAAVDSMSRWLQEHKRSQGQTPEP